MTENLVPRLYTLATDIVATAMQISLWKQIEFPMNRQGSRLAEPDLIRWTEHKCALACAFALTEISRIEDNSGLFDRHILLTSWRDSQQSFGQLRHAYFMVRDTQEQLWYIGSPANFVPGEYPAAFDIESGDLEDIIESFQRSSGGIELIWPNQDDIEGILDTNMDYTPVRMKSSSSMYTHKISVFEIQARPQGVMPKQSEIHVDFRISFPIY